MNDSPKKRPSKSRLETNAKKDLKSIPKEALDFALDLFADEYSTRLHSIAEARADANEKGWKRDLLKSVIEKLHQKYPSVHVSANPKNFDRWVAAAHKQGLMRIVPRVDAALSQDMTTKIGVQTTVVAGHLSDRFAEVAAAIVVEDMIRIAKQKEAKASPAEVCIGIVSGLTCRNTIKYVCSCDWKKDLGVDLKSHKVIFRIFPLNVTLVGPASLGGNATILSHELAEKIEKEGGKAYAYGLNADLIVSKRQLREVDMRFVQTQTILGFTEPYRINEAEPPETTKLDLVLTGVGQRPDPNDPSGGSLFVQLMKENKFETEKSIAGDLAFYPLSPDGEPASVMGPGNQEFMFYSAISLRILETMASDPTNRSVILVAQSKEQQDKIRIILASTRALNQEKRPYISRLVIDETLSKGLSAFL